MFFPNAKNPLKKYHQHALNWYKDNYSNFPFELDVKNINKDKTL